jgi:tRNA pseudouridine55 synthase
LSPQLQRPLKTPDYEQTNPKSESRNPKQIQITKAARNKPVWNISDLDFGFVSDCRPHPRRLASLGFGFRYSDLIMLPQLTPFDGVLLVDKPPRLTSHDVVDRIRRHFGFNKVGHCGTLDPAATGLLVIVLERATKLQDKLMADDKTYEGTLRLGVATDSQDADGEIVAEKPVPPLVAADIEAIFQKFTGDIQQIPPMVSAKKIGGVPLYKMARKGKTIEREPRTVHIYSFKLLNFESPRADFRVTCTKGTYVRTLCHDIGEQLGCGGHLAALRRTRSGNLDIADAKPLDELLKLNRQQLEPHIVSILKLIKPA